METTKNTQLLRLEKKKERKHKRADPGAWGMAGLDDNFHLKQSNLLSFYSYLFYIVLAYINSAI